MKKIIMLAFPFLFLLCGCTGYREIERSYLATAMGIFQENNKICLTVEVISSSNLADKSSQRQFLTATGSTIDTAFKSLKAQLVKPIYFEQLGAVVFDNFSSDEGIIFLKTLPEINYDIFLVKTNDITALFGLETPGGILGYDIIGLIKNHNEQNSTKVLNQFYQIERNNGSLPTVNVTDGKLTLDVSGE